MNLSEKRAAHIAKSYGVNLDEIALNEIIDLVKAHKMHKYLTIENGKYIYDYDKMSSQDHEKAIEHHKKELHRYKKQPLLNQRRHKDVMDSHKEHIQKHSELAKEKSEDKVKTTMTNLEWGKTTNERNENLDKYDSLKTTEEKEDFLKKLKEKNK